MKTLRVTQESWLSSGQTAGVKRPACIQQDLFIWVTKMYKAILFPVLLMTYIESQNLSWNIKHMEF